MCRIRVKPSKIKGGIVVPSSKSQTMRALLFATLATGISTIDFPLLSPDTNAMINACRGMGAQITIKKNQIIVKGVSGTIEQLQDEIDVGNSGIVLRFCAAIGALGNQRLTLRGDRSIESQRPVQPLLDALSQLGVEAKSLKGNGYAPISICGPLKPGYASFCGADSQPVSGMLIASAFAKGPIQLEVQNAGEKPWVALTLDWFDRLSIPYQNNNFKYYTMYGNSRYNGFHYNVPGDLSSAAFPLASALITGSALTIENIDMDDMQGDKALIPLLQSMGAEILIDRSARTLTVSAHGLLRGTKVDINSFIDAVPIFAVIACFAEGSTHITNASIARQKECDRLHCITTELKKMGADIEETADGLIIKHSQLQGAHVSSHDDHRMAMALAIAGMAANGETVVDGVSCISKTYPTFYDDFVRIGAQLEIAS